MKFQSVGYCPFVSVIIPTFNRAQSLEETLRSLINQNYEANSYEIIVVDNNSSDHTKDLVACWKNKSAVPLLYLFEGRQGVHYARNTAFRYAKGEILYYTDDDMTADKELIKEIVKPFAYDPKIAVSTGPVLP